MILMNKLITQEHLDVYSRLSVDAMAAMTNVRPGWSYRGSVQNGTLLVDFKTWEEFMFRRMEKIKIYCRSKQSWLSKSNFDDHLFFLPIEELTDPRNWRYCVKINDDYHRKEKTSLSLPGHASFVTDNLEWLLNSSKNNLEASNLEITGINSNNSGMVKHVTLFTNDDKYYRGEGSTLSIAALDLFGKTYKTLYEAKRPSFSYLTGDNIDITHLIEKEPTIEVYYSPHKFITTGFILNKYNFRQYEFFMAKQYKKRISELLGKKYNYYGKYHLLEGDFHIIDVEKIQ